VHLVDVSCFTVPEGACYELRGTAGLPRIRVEVARCLRCTTRESRTEVFGPRRTAAARRLDRAAGSTAPFWVAGLHPIFAVVGQESRLPLSRKMWTETRLLAALIVIWSSMTVAAAAHSPNLNERHTGPANEVGASTRPRSFEPPRMIEVRPGWWISTYDCVSDEGQGR
jgi:hypothetical protein